MLKNGCILDLVQTVEKTTVKTERKQVKRVAISAHLENRLLLKKTHMVKFAPDSTDPNHFRTMIKSAKAIYNIKPAGMKKWYDIHRSASEKL